MVILNGLQTGDTVELYGEYKTNPKGECCIGRITILKNGEQMGGYNGKDVFIIDEGE